MNILITGAGLAGCYTAREAMAKGHKVTLFDISPNPAYIRAVAGEVDVVKGDVIDLPFLIETFQSREIDAVFHSAYLIGDRLSERPYTGLNVNVGGVIAIAEAVRLSGAKRMVFASTYGVYNWASGPTRPVGEEFPVLTNVLYRASKIACESLLHALGNHYGFETAVVRFAQIYGRGHYIGGDVIGGVVHEYMNAALAGGPVHIHSNIFGSNELIYAGDLAQGVVLALERPLTEARVFNIGTGVVTDSEGLASIFREVFPEITVDVSPGPEVAFTPYRPQPLDIDRARNVLGYGPVHLGASGISSFVEDLKRSSWTRETETRNTQIDRARRRT